MAVSSLAAGCVGELSGEPSGEPDDVLLPELARPWDDASIAPAPTATHLPAPAGERTPDVPAEERAPDAPAEELAASMPDLGALPAELSALAWPVLPRTTREVTVTTAEALGAEAAIAGTRILARGVVGGDLSIGADDVEIVADASTSLGTLSIPARRARVRIEGGRWRGVRVAIPADFTSGAAYDPAQMAHDLTFDAVSVDSGAETAFEVRGKRIAIVRSEVHGGRYSVWCGDTAHFQSEDLILADNTMRSAGPEPTVRFVSVLRSAVVSNVLTNTYKHNYRIHGVSDLNFAADNLLVETGVMFGRMEGDRLGRVWFDDNVLHHRAPDLFNPDASIGSLRARRNVAYTDARSAFYEGVVRPGWELEENQVMPYEPAPAF